MGAAWCQKCKRTRHDSLFDRKPDGTIKGWCRRCCRRQGVKNIRFSGSIKKKYGGLTYKSRQKVLRRIGFKTYAEYLDSFLWKQIRWKVYEAKGTLCVLCGNEATQLHHNRYHRNDMLGKNLTYIEPVCGSCHKSVEFTSGVKNTLAQARGAFADRIATLASHTS